MNPTAVAFWIFCSGIGFLIGDDLRSAIVGTVTGIGISLLIGILTRR